ncbi:hypothetical protein [Negadavirga shengliensis]|uniref:Uncharacterized protein n=1 Tax=Negadavirga shengliensis TaxID=1389218 RepID=A0ABV9T7S3_9BACT
MKIFKRTENIIILTLWLTILSTYPYALLNDYNLFLSDYLGLAGLTIVTLIAFYIPKMTFKSLMVLLFFGLFNLFSFIYFINLVFTFGFASIVSPGIQLLSLILLLILAFKRQGELGIIWTNLFGQTDEEIQQNKDRMKDSFKVKFINLSDKEIENRLQNDLVGEARKALIEIQNERKNAL